MKYIWLLTLMILFVGCNSKWERITSDTLHEDAIVLEKIFTPSRHETKMSPALIDGGMIGIGIHGGGFNCNGIVITNSTVPEIFGILFKCKHGTFTSQGSDERHKQLYMKLEKGDKVDVTYKEMFNIYLERRDRNSKWSVKTTELAGFDFLDANKIE